MAFELVHAAPSLESRAAIKVVQRYNRSPSVLDSREDMDEIGTDENMILTSEVNT